MNILELMKSKTSESSSISKIKDETIQSFDVPSSLELGKTKDTSVFSATKLKNTLANNNNNSLLGNGSIFKRLINSSDFTYKAPKHKGTNNKHINLTKRANGCLTAKSKYLSGTLNHNGNQSTSFAAKREKFSLRQGINKINSKRKSGKGKD